MMQVQEHRTGGQIHRSDEYMAEVRRIVDLAPKLTAAQRDLIATILRPSAGGEL